MEAPSRIEDVNIGVYVRLLLDSSYLHSIPTWYLLYTLIISDAFYHLVGEHPRSLFNV